MNVFLSLTASRWSLQRRALSTTCLCTNHLAGSPVHVRFAHHLSDGRCACPRAGVYVASHFVHSLRSLTCALRFRTHFVRTQTNASPHEVFFFISLQDTTIIL